MSVCPSPLPLLFCPLCRIYAHSFPLAPYRIRPLLEDDLRRRRISGRHQISVDGRHLVDGVAFGRPWLKAPVNRPAIDLPPRKRARITYDSDEEYDDEEEDGDYDDYAEDEDEEGSDDFSSLEAEEDTEDEDQLLLEAPGSESVVDESTNATPQPHIPGSVNSPGSLKRGRGVDSSPVVSRSGSTNSTTPHRSPRLSTVRFLSPKAPEPHHSRNPAKRRKLENRLHTPLKPKAGHVVDTSSPAHATPDKEPGSSKSAEPEPNEPCPVGAEVKSPTPEGPVGTACPESSSDSGDSTVSLSSLARSKDGVERQENSTDGEAHLSPAVNEDKPDKSGYIALSNSSSDDDSDSDSSSEDSSGSDDSASDAPDRVNSDGPGNSSDSDSSSDDSSDSDSSDSSDVSESSSDGPVSVEGVGPRDSVAQHEHGVKAQTKAAPAKKSEAVVKKVPLAATPFAAVTPEVTGRDANAGQVHLTRSQKRNLRRRLARLKKEEGAVGFATATGTAAPADTGSAEVVAELLRRKQALLESIGAEKSSPASANPLKRKASDIEETPARGPDCDGTLATAKTNGTAESEAAATRKLRLDLGAGRRLLFGALGVRNPKTREEEDKVRDALAKNVRPLTTTRTEEQADLQDKVVVEPPEDEDPDAWRRKINYRAVECCHEGVELSEPPFPFVQRWDPQQRPDVWFGGNNKKNKRGGKGKKKLRNQAHYYDGGYDVVDETQLSYTAAGGVTDSRSLVPPQMGDTVMGEATDVPRPTTPQDKNANATADATEDVPESRDDLPVLPDDLSTLAPLLPGAATPGMVITWKKWLLSKATQWQPQVSNVTAVVAKVDDADANTLKVFLAKRDRALDKPEKDYDPETGERVYDGFEAPDTDEDEQGDGGEDDGERNVTFAEMMDPRVVQPALPSVAVFGSGFAGQVPDEDGVGYLQDSIESQGGDVADSNEVMGDATEPMSLDLQVPFSDPVESVGLPGSSPARARARELPPSNQLPQMSGENTCSLRVPVTEYPSQNTTSLDALGNLSVAGSVASGRGQVDPNFVGVESYDSQEDAIPDSAVALEGDAATEQSGPKEKNDGKVRPLSKLVSSSQPVLPSPSAGQRSAAVPAPQTPKSSPEAPGRVLRAKETIRLPGSEASFFDGEQAELAREKSAKMRKNEMLKNLSASTRKNTSARRLEETVVGGSPNNNNNNNVQRRIFSSSQSSAVPKIVKMEKLDLSERAASLSQIDSRTNAVVWGGGKKNASRKNKVAVEKDVFEVPAGSQVIDLTSDGEGAAELGGKQATQGTQGSGGLTEGIPNGGGWVPKKKKERKTKARF